MADIPDAFRRHASAPYVSDADVQAALAVGSFVVNFVDSAVPAGNLAYVYRRRARHLKKFATHYGQRLASDVANFSLLLERLDPTAEVAMSEIELGDGRSITVWEVLSTRELLGVLSLFDQRALSVEQRRKPWGEDS